LLSIANNFGETPAAMIHSMIHSIDSFIHLAALFAERACAHCQIAKSQKP